MRNQHDIANEYLIVGCFYQQPDLYLQYGKLIKSKYDFYDESTKFLYDTFELYYTSFSDVVEEKKLNTFAMQDETRKKQYMMLNGFQTIQDAINLADADDFEKYYDTFKKYSLIRELERKGFPVNRILEHPKFDKISAKQVIQWMRGSIDKIQTIIGGESDTHILGSDMVSQVLQWKEKPALGIPFPFDLQTFLFRGWLPEKILVDGMLSNEGKSRKAAFLASYVSLILGETVLFMVNEMSEEDMKAAMLTTVCNSPEFGFELGISERTIITGEYENEKQLQAVLEVAEYFEKYTKIYFQDMGGSYSDKDIEYQCRKHVITMGVTCVFYDTMKGYRSDNWETLKQTATQLKDIARELKVRMYATIQLTDDSIHLDIHSFSSMNIANAKQIKHVVDFLILEKKIDIDKYNMYSLENQEWGENTPLDKRLVYYGQKIDKNRAGSKGMVLCQVVDLDLNTWKEVGFLIRNKKKKKESNL